MMIEMDQEVRREGVLFEGDWLPLVGLPIFEAKAMLRDAGNISYFADAIVNGRLEPVAHILRRGDRLEFVQRIGIKAGDDKPIEEAIGEAMVIAYSELLEMAQKVKAMNLPTDRSLDVMTGMVAEWAEQRFGFPRPSTMSVIAEIGKRLQRIESLLDDEHSTKGQEHHALAGADSRDDNDGPQPPDRFRLFGKEYKGISRDQWLLLKALWPQRTAEIEDVMEQVYGTNFKQEQEALRSVARRLTECLGRQSCPAEIVIRNGYCTLEIFDEPRKVVTDRGTTG